MEKETSARSAGDVETDPGLGRQKYEKGERWIANDDGADITVLVPVSGGSAKDYTFRIEMTNGHGMTLRFDQPDIIDGDHPVVLTAGAKISEVRLKVGTAPSEYCYGAVTTEGDVLMGAEEESEESGVTRRRPRIVVAIGFIPPD